MKKLLFSSFYVIVFIISCTGPNRNNSSNTDTISKYDVSKNLDTPSKVISVPIQGNPIIPIEDAIMNDSIVRKGNPIKKDSSRTNKIINHGSPNQDYVDSVKAAKSKTKKNY
jgi:hypothetical protein